MTSELKEIEAPVTVVTPWPLDEVSTRNCYNCLAPREGRYVSCRLGHPLITRSGNHRRRLAYNGVVRNNSILKPCQGCHDFDNDWAKDKGNGRGTR